MSETSALRPGQKATLTGTVIGVQGRAIELEVRESGENYVGWNHIVVDASALTPVVDPEPQWVPGDVVRIDGMNYMLRLSAESDPIWISAKDEWLNFAGLSQRWREGRVEILHKEPTDG